MPLLDVCQLIFDPAITIEDEGSIFCKEWHMTIKYVLSQPGLIAAYTSRLTTKHEVWFLLLWETEKSREHFYHQTVGFGFMSKRMMKAPNVFFFGNESYQELDQTSKWTIDVLGAETQDAGNSEQVEDSTRRNKVQEQRFAEIFGQHNFIARKEETMHETLYQANVLYDAYVGLIRSDFRGEQDSKDDSRWHQYSVELRKYEPSAPSSCTHVDVPIDIADLTRRQPCEYGMLDCDTSEYSDTAYPMSLSFRPMSTLGMAEEFAPTSVRQQDVQSEDGNEHTLCIVSLLVDFSHATEYDTILEDELRKQVGLQDEVQGLRELSILRMVGSQAQARTIQMLCAWDTNSDFEQWRQSSVTHDHCKLESVWTSNEVWLLNLELANMPLTPDKKSYQHVDKVLEIVEFNFAHNLSATEKEAFQQHVHEFTSTMSSCWSGSIDERPVVYAEEPVWDQFEEGTPSCLLLLAWDGTAQRTAWLRNFVANGFVWTGHLAHALGVLCSQVGSGTYSMAKVYTSEATYGRSTDVDGQTDSGDDSDRDMGF